MSSELLNAWSIEVCPHPIKRESILSVVLSRMPAATPNRTRGRSSVLHLHVSKAPNTGKTVVATAEQSIARLSETIPRATVRSPSVSSLEQREMECLGVTTWKGTSKHSTPVRTCDNREQLLGNGQASRYMPSQTIRVFDSC